MEMAVSASSPITKAIDEGDVPVGIDEWTESAKYSHAAVNYVPCASESLNQLTVYDQCGNCENFVAPDGCKHVKSPIAITGWCEMYEEA
jgi:hypothetical protein